MPSSRVLVTTLLRTCTPRIGEVAVAPRAAMPLDEVPETRKPSMVT
jgi:hypothetical protein